MRDWLADQLVTDYPAQGAPAPAGTDGGTCAGALLAAGLILPVLDGLDEIPEAARGLRSTVSMMVCGLASG